jgi:hypothetical protein
MTAPHLNRALVLEGVVRTPDGAGGFTEAWAALGTLWAELVNSSSNCNTCGSPCDFLCESLGRSFPSQGLAGAVVHQSCDVVEIALTELSQIGALGQKLAEEAVGVLI